MEPKQENYRLKRIEFNNRKAAIVLQNTNGPCPLLAVANILLLRGDLKIHEDHAVIGAEELLERVGEYLLDIKVEVNDQYRANHEMNVNDLIQMLPTTQRGIDVNVQFKSITAFEFTSECMLFDFCNTRLVHGWLADPQDVEMYSFIHNLSYNQLVEKQILYQTLLQDLSKKMESLDIQKDGAVDAAKSEEASATTKEGLLAERFIAESASQITYHGLSELHSGLKEEELCVFFRNNHFSTLYKHGGELLLLVTDQGYANEPLVWEKLNQIDGDSVFLRSDYARYEATSPSIAAVLGSHVTDDGFIIEDEQPIANSDSDLALAMQMQQEEDDRAQRAAAAAANGGSAAEPQSEHKKNRRSKEKKDGCIIQ